MAESDAPRRRIPAPVLRKRPAFLVVQRHGQRWRGHLLALWIYRRDPPAVAHLGLTVSRRVGNAVRRNRVKRRLKEIVRCHPGWLGDGCDHVVVARPAAALAPFAKLQAELGSLLARARRASRGRDL